MCGIAGALRLSRSEAFDIQAVVSRLNDLQQHRGPDGDGLWTSEDGIVTLGHRRLAIIDTGTSGSQPMFDATGRWVITFNGEIYNYRELRLELEERGVEFVTESDTEVLINVVANWGELGLRRLRGMFAFALWDALERELWLVRDPHGIKPLYYGQSLGTVWFASQATALARAAPVDLRRDPAALVGFYLWGHVPEPFSWWGGVSMLPAGHVWRIRGGQGLGKPEAFTRVEDSYVSRPASPLRPGELKSFVTDSVAHHLIADVEVGIFLSAGIDSSVVAAIASELGHRVKTVTLAFQEYEGTDLDEAPVAEQTARLIGADHQTIRIGRDEIHDLTKEFMLRMDSPSIDGLNTFLISYAARSQGLKVALSGLGADELFGGYPSFRQIPRLLHYSRYVPQSGLLNSGAHKLLRALSRFGLPPKSPGLLTHSGDIAHAFILRRALFLQHELEEFLDESWIEGGACRLDTINKMNATIRSCRTSNVPVHAQISALESGWYMRNQLLRDADWASMAHGLEVRLPFVDCELSHQLGPSIASASPPRKADLAACSELLPSSLSRRPKTGFTTPVADWIEKSSSMRDRGLRGWAHHVRREFRAAHRSASTP